MVPTITDQLRHVFVYGTLRKGQERDINRLRPAPIFIGNSQINGTLYNLGSYPGVRLGGAQGVQGEVYQITPELERQLDEIEEVWPQQTGEYVKGSLLIQCAGLSLTCLVYELAESRAQGGVVMASGDWVRR
jgi:gamma-glutamylcyclotransferase (GGCT)/AIG2-like uncharacterized protein YtfP